MNLNGTQIILIIIAVLSALSGATAQLTDVFGTGVAHMIVSASGLLSTIMTSILVPLTGQTAQLKAVQAMPGVEAIQVNAKANPTLAGLAVDPAQDKIEAAPGAEQAVKKAAAS